MDLTRRDTCRLLAAAATVSPLAAAPPVWTGEWDRAIVAAALAGLDPAFDPAVHMLKRRVGAEYSYHSGLRASEVHPTRDSLEYALLLLEAGGFFRQDRAQQIIAQTIALQDHDPRSKWYGIWGYYLEEPPPDMAPADWNWADFNGALLLEIEARHGRILPGTLRDEMLDSIHHAAYSVRRRNVSMNYTNIAVQGTFVTLAAADLLHDEDLRNYALDRLHRFANTVDVTGSFAEYNSPTYANVTIANLTRMRTLIRDASVVSLVDRIHERAWLHLGKHWHAPTRQLAGPMSRCYRTDIGQPLWIQKALGGRIEFATLDEIRGRKVPTPGEVGILGYRCPASVAPLFLDFHGARQHREVFLPGPAGTRAVQGTTWLDRRFCLGSVNRGDFWTQRRSLLAYWGGGGRTAGYLQLRVMKDDYDFASALLYAVQEKNCVLGLIAFRSPGGDKHPSLDPIAGGEFTARRLRARFDLAGLPPKPKIYANGEPIAVPAGFPAETSLLVDTGAVKIWLQFRAAGQVTLDREEGAVTISLDWFNEKEPRKVRWQDLQTPSAVFRLAMDPGAHSRREFEARCRDGEFLMQSAGQAATFSWRSPVGQLALTAGTAVRAIADQDRAFGEMLDGEPVPLRRLSEERLGEG